MLHGCKWFLAVYVDFICILICQYLCVYVFMSSSGTCDWEFVFDLRLHFGIILGAVVSIGASWAQIGFTLGTIVIHYSFGGHLWCSGLTLWEIWTSREASSRVAPHLTEVRIQLKALGLQPFICWLSNLRAAAGRPSSNKFKCCRLYRRPPEQQESYISQCFFEKT